MAGSKTRVNLMECSVKGCDRHHYAKGLCRAHYQHLRRFGTFEFTRGIPIIERIKSRIIVSPTGCWLYQGTLNKKGYAFVCGRFAHRVMWEDRFGTIPEGREIDHLCRNRNCCNPEHLETVTHAENIRRGDTGKNLRNPSREHQRRAALIRWGKKLELI